MLLHNGRFCNGCITINYLLTYDSYGPVHNRFHRGLCITWASGGGEGALDTPGPLNGMERSAQGPYCFVVLVLVCREFYVNVNEVNPGPILLCGAHTVVLCCDGDFNWLGQVWGGGDLTPPWRSGDYHPLLTV